MVNFTNISEWQKPQKIGSFINEYIVQYFNEPRSVLERMPIVYVGDIEPCSIYCSPSHSEQFAKRNCLSRTRLAKKPIGPCRVIQVLLFD